MDSNASESARTSRDGSFLSQAGLVTLLLGVTLCALGVFLEHPTAGVVTFAACVVASTAMAAFAPNNLISTITLAITIPIIVLGGLACLLSFMS